MSDTTASTTFANPFPIVVGFPVRGYEIDSLGHVNNAVYLQWMEHARWEMSKVPAFALFAGVIPVVRHLEIDYRMPVFYGEDVEVMMWPRRCQNTSFVLGGAIRITKSEDASRVGKIAVVIGNALACTDMKGGKLPVPDAFRAFFPAEDTGFHPPASILS